MKRHRLVLIFALIVITCGAASPRKVTKRPASLVLLYTSSADGQIRSCNCTKFRFGGYGRELTVLKSIRSHTKDSLLIEGGDVVGGNGFQADLKADVAAQALPLLRYGAMTPGEKELGVRGVRYLARFAKRLPVVCANVFRGGQPKPICPPYRVVKTASGFRVAIIGAIDPALCSPWLSTSFGESAKDVTAVLPSIIKDARTKSDMVVLVYHGMVDGRSSLKNIKGLDLILVSHRHAQDKLFPSKDSNMVEAPVGRLGSATLVYSETSTNWCLGRLDIALTPDGKIRSAKHKLIYLDRSYDEDPAMVKLYDAYNVNVQKAVLESSAAFKTNAEAMLLKRGLNLTAMRQRLRASTIATAEKCKDCHPEIYKIWSDSSHAHAMATLQKTHQEYDPECVRCHVTGGNQRNGFINEKETPELANVQCEACHGSAVEHVKAPASGFGKVNEATCRSCHTDERTPDFDYAVSWAKIMH